MADQPPVEVIAAAITDPRGRILLARRTAGRDLAGLWEFPGGKREPGETPEQALARELEEELGIQVQVGAPIITVPQAYPGKRLRLDVRRVSAWKGIPRGNEGQALAWVPPHRLASYAMPPADIPVVAALTQPDRYLVTPSPHGADPDPPCDVPADTDENHPRRPRERGDPASSFPPADTGPSHLHPPRGFQQAHAWSRGGPWASESPDPASLDAAWLAGIQRALDSGIRRLHLRLPGEPIGTLRAAAAAQPPSPDLPPASAQPPSPGLTPARRESLIRQAVALAHAAGAEALIGGDIELARATGAGVHLRAAQLAGLHQRPLPAAQPVAASCHDETELRHAQRLACDFAVLGPVQPTPTHPEAPGLGWTRFAALRETVSLPIYAIGGLTPANISHARQHGAQGIAAIRALWPDPP